MNALPVSIGAGNHARRAISSSTSASSASTAAAARATRPIRPPTASSRRSTRAAYRHWLANRNIGGLRETASDYTSTSRSATRICFYCACNKIMTRDHGRAREVRALPAARDGARRRALGGDRAIVADALGRRHAHVPRRRGHGALMVDAARDVRLRPARRVLDRDRSAHGRSPRASRCSRALGFNRMSLGVQDFDPEVQRAVNRIQSYEETRARDRRGARARLPLDQHRPDLRPAEADRRRASRRRSSA